MSTIASRPNQETRQQLEELDALIQRMLGMPLSLDLETPAPSPQLPALPRSPASPPILPPPAANLSIKSFPQAAPTVPGTVSVQAWRVEMPAPLPPAPEVIPPAEVPWASAVETATEPLPLPRFKLPPVVAIPQSLPTFAPTSQPRPVVYGSNASLPPLAEPIAGLMKSSPTNSPVAAPVLPQTNALSVPDMPVPLTLWPIIGFNRLVELLLYCLGPIGKAFTSSIGRNILGAIGVLMIVGAVAWGILDWLGLGWPR